MEMKNALERGAQLTEGRSSWLNGSYENYAENTIIQSGLHEEAQVSKHNP